MRKIATTGSEEARHTKDSKKNLRVPSLRLHKASGQAYVVLNGKAVNGKAKPWRGGGIVKM